MHRKLLNTLRLRIQIRPEGPLLVKAGGFALDPTIPDMAFVRVRLADGREVPYLPGSSLKGTIRGFVEKILRTWDQPDWRRACATFPDHPESCAYRVMKQEEKDPALPTSEIYRMSCGACRMFGHTRLRGRAAFTDAYPDGELTMETRYGVAISRRTQAVAHGPFEMEVAVAGTFFGHVILENFELWQAALLAHAFEAMNEGMLRVGYGKTRGLGMVRVEVVETMLDVAGLAWNPHSWPSIAGLLDPEACKAYGLDPMEWIPMEVEPDAQISSPFFTRRIYKGHEKWIAISWTLRERALRLPEG